jgi:hypothetical protein
LILVIFSTLKNCCALKQGLIYHKISYLFAGMDGRLSGWVYCTREGKQKVQTRRSNDTRPGLPGGSKAAGWASTLLFVFTLVFSFGPGCLAENVETASLEPSGEVKKDLVDSLQWAKPLAEGPDKMYYFVEAISGKKLKPKTYDVLHGVTDVSLQESKIVFHRVDKEELELRFDTEHGAKFSEDWEKAKVNLESKFGPSGREFLDSVDSVHLAGDRIEVVRKGTQDTRIDLGGRKLHRTFDVRGLRFRQLSMKVDRSGKHSSLKDIEGVTAVINAPGFSFPVEVKEFSKIKLEKVNDIKVGVRNPMPTPVRAILFMPSILRFHFLLSRKE